MKQLIAIAFLLPFLAFAQNDTVPDTAQVEALIQQLFPESSLLFLETGELNNDGFTDIVAVVSRPCEAEKANLGTAEEPTVCRRAVFIMQRRGVFAIAAASDNVIDCSLCGGGWDLHDAYDHLEIEDGKILFFSEYGACQRELFIHTYSWDEPERQWFLESKSLLRGDCNSPEQGFMPVETTTAADFGRISFNDPEILKKL
jgi:hypothetical protein